MIAASSCSNVPLTVGLNSDHRTTQELLEKRQTQYNIKLLVDELVRGVHSPPPPTPPTPPGPNISQRFAKNNPYLHYQVYLFILIYLLLFVSYFFGYHYLSLTHDSEHFD